MNISNNILKENLKNVYFLSGGAYGGKTTMAKLIEKKYTFQKFTSSEKYGFVRFRQGDHYEEYASIANPDFQPAMSMDRSKDWHGFFSQPIEQYSKWLTDSMNEETEFAIMDLIKLSHHQKVIADVGISPAILKKISDPSRVILLFAPEEMTRKHYFDRDDKQEVYRLIKSFPDGDKLLQNVIDALHYNAAKVRQAYYESGFYCIERSENDTIEKTLEKIEKHFSLCG